MSETQGFRGLISAYVGGEVDVGRVGTEVMGMGGR